jgi:3-oxoacyl-[acyl-carrier protein] reductase
VPTTESELFKDFITVDLKDSREINFVCERISQMYLPLWGFVYCAGIYPIKSLNDYTLELWDEVQAINLRAIFYMIKLLCPGIEKGGRIVIIASGAAHLGSRDVGYSSSKAGVIGLVRSLAKLLAPDILVNAVCPGVIKTQMSSRMPPEHLREYLKIIPLGRFGTPEEVSACISFLLDEGNTYMTGATIDINGGLYAR